MQFFSVQEVLSQKVSELVPVSPCVLVCNATERNVEINVGLHVK
jgi:hypothetical protein